MGITFVKKILANGEPCPKCQDVQQKLENNDQMQFIDKTLIADERDPNSAGMRLAQSLQVERAPFFVVEQDGKTEIYTVYLKFVKEVLKPNKVATPLDKDIDKEVLKNSSDLDFL